MKLSTNMACADTADEAMDHIEQLETNITLLNKRIQQFGTFLEELSTPIGELDGYNTPDFLEEINRLLEDYGVPYHYIETPDPNNPVSFRRISPPPQE